MIIIAAAITGFACWCIGFVSGIWLMKKVEELCSGD